MQLEPPTASENSFLLDTFTQPEPHVIYRNLFLSICEFSTSTPLCPINLNINCSPTFLVNVHVAVPKEILLQSSIELGTHKKKRGRQLYIGKATNRCFQQKGRGNSRSSP